MRPFDPKTYLVDVLSEYVGPSTTDLPDLFVRYLLEPGDDDDTAIAARMAEVKALWDKRLEHAKYGQLIRTLSAEHLEAELTLCDPDERSTLAKKAADRDRDRTKKAADALASWRAIVDEHVKTNHGLDPSRRVPFERMATKQGLDKAVVKRELLDALPIAKMPDLIEPARRQRVRKALSQLAQAVGEPRLSLSLYHALGLELTDDGGVVQERYEAAMRENSQRAIGDTATLYKSVFSEVKLLLIDADPRAYREGLVQDVREELELDAAKKAASGLIDATEAEQLLRRALELGLTQDLGRRVINELAKEHGASIEVGAAVDYVACPSCNVPHSRTSAVKACGSCGTALFVECPKDGCGTSNDATASRCSSCGTDLHRYTAATRRLPTLPATLAEGNVAAAAAELAEITRVLGDAGVPEDLRRRVADAARRAQSEWDAVEAAIGARRLFAARAAVRRLQKDARDVVGPSGETPAVRGREIERRLAELDTVLARARAASGEARERALVQAIALAADCDEATAALDAIVPEPPGEVEAKMSSSGPVLTWAPSPTIGARYAVRRVDVRGAATAELGETSEARFDDRDAPTGAFVRYDVATARGASRSSASSSPPLTVAREVAGLSLADSDGEVRLTWRPVPASARVLVFRRDASGGDEREIVADRSGVVDRSVRNGRRYGYRVCVEYAGDGSRTQRTGGLTVFGQPAPPPEAISALSVRQLPDGALIEFARPPLGSVTVLRCDSEPEVEPGAMADPARLSDLGRVLPTDARGARDSSPGGICWYLPITIAGGTAVVGHARRHLALHDIANVKAVERPNEVKVTWEWPEGVRIAKVIWRRDSQPSGPDDAAAESAWVRLGEYRDHGGFAIEARGQKPVFLAVVPGIRVDGDLLAGTMIPRGARASVRPSTRVVLRYQVRRTGMRKKRLQIEVHAPIGAETPGLVLVARDGDLLPRHASDGEVVARLGGGEPLTSTIDIGSRPKPLMVRLFLGPAGAAGGYQLFDPTADDLLIS